MVQTLIKPVVERPHGAGNGIQKLYRFPNGYGASVVRFSMLLGGYGSYTNNEDEWELAVVKFKGKKNDSFELDYSTPLTGDVIGHLTDEEVQEILRKIKALKK